MDNGTTVWEMTADQAMEFFQMAMDLNLNTESERLALLDYMRQKGNLTRVYTTKRGKVQVMQDLAKHYKIGVVKNNRTALND
jgi:hypothetical protein